MNCRDFDRTWNDRLDARGGPREPEGRALEAHAAACPACRSLAARYRTLRQALLAWGPPPAVPAGFLDRFLERREVAEARPATRAQSTLALSIPIAVAASLVLAVALASRFDPGGGAEHSAPVPSVPTAAPRPLTDVLAEATSAGWDLARHASAPAARIGRQVFDSATVRLPSTPFAKRVRVRPVSGVLQRVERRVHVGVRPSRAPPAAPSASCSGCRRAAPRGEGSDAPRGA